MTPHYRADIDGLRALAVLSVLFFHSGITLFSGGYVGVDIFFVISGYLITAIIVREIANNDFSLSRFYERRFRRILPSLVVVFVVCLVAGLWLLTPKKLINFAESAAATALFSSNILFYFETGYFDDPSLLKPLLHTWSLAVEEQYYIFFPLLLVLIARVDAKHYFKWLGLLGLLSFIACVIVTRIDASAAFYLLPTRAWELFIGSILALHVLPAVKNANQREFAAAFGLTLIAFSIFTFTGETAFPGFAALAPTAGAGLIIYAGISGPSLVSRMLSWRPIVFVGLISYSLYLWHWPVLVYSKIYLIRYPDTTAMLFMMAVSFVLSVFSWRYIETPFRKKHFFADKLALLRAAAFVSLLIVTCGIVLKISDGFPQRNGNIAALNPAIADVEWEHWSSCDGVPERIKNNRGLCFIGAPTGDTRFILWGDSHARALASGVDWSAKKYGAAGVIATELACPPLLDVDRARQKSCTRFNNDVLTFIANTPEINTVILAGRWALSSTGRRYKQEAGLPVKLTDTQTGGTTGLSNADVFDIGLNRTVAALQKMGKRVVLVYPVPEVGFPVPAAYFVARITGQDINTLIAPTTAEYKLRTFEVALSFEKISRQFPVQFVAVDHLLCAADYCTIIADGQPLYRDDDHLSTFGSKYLAPLFDDVFRPQ